MTMTPEQRRTALETEATRIKERLDQLDRYLQGHPDAWATLIERLPDHVAEVVIDKAMSEARQQALALATITKTLAQLSEDKGEAEVDPLAAMQRARQDELAARRASKTS